MSLAESLDVGCQGLLEEREGAPHITVSSESHAQIRTARGNVGVVLPIRPEAGGQRLLGDPDGTRRVALAQDKNAQIILITPDLESGIEKSVTLVKPDFKIIRDLDLKISQKYQVISDEKFNSFKGDLGNGKKFIPVPATYVIGQDGKIIYSYFDKDYKVRASFNEVINSLDN